MQCTMTVLLEYYSKTTVLLEYMLSVPFRKIVCEFGPVRSGPFRGIVDPTFGSYIASYKWA